MESLDIATTAISNIGFPIFCVLALGYFVWKAFNIVITSNKERETMLYNTIAEIRAQLSAASKTNAEFVRVLDGMQTSMNGIKEDVEDIKEKIKE